MGAMPIVAMQPVDQLGGSLLRALISTSIGLNEALDLTISM
jgi:hypothetical protein